ncbi:MAG: V-type ATP synthase subunit B [Candidatus Micrarchaeales archaeon]|nr:V-type ATP synthase subunit B [Candidatus Micrarchaeales archaeon]
MKFGIEYRTIESISGPLIVVKNVRRAAYNELVRINLQNGEERLGQVLETSDTYAIVQVFGQTDGLNLSDNSVTFLGETFEFGVTEDMLGRVFNGEGRPIDIKAEVIPETKLDVNGSPMNPTARAVPTDFIETGISAIDGLITLVRGQKLPIFSGAGLQHNALAAQIAKQAQVKGKSSEEFAVVFAGIGITYDDANYFIEEFRTAGSLSRSVTFMNLADSPSIERILTPRLALTTAEYLAFEEGMHVLVILNDMTNYAEALRELSSSRDEVPGRRGYPGYMYTDFASVYERAGILKNKKGSITQLNIVSMPGDDVTHPVPDLTGYVTEGQIFLSRDLQNKGIYPSINPLGSLSRLMNQGIGVGKTREDHRGVSDQLYGAYAKAQEARSLSTIVGMEALSDLDKLYLSFGDSFEKNFIAQKFDERRTIEETLDIGWELLSALPESEMTRISRDFIKKYRKVVK